jgi:hypothetical protein
LTKTHPRIDAIPNGVIDTLDLLTVHKFLESVKLDDNLYSGLEDDKDFIKLDRDLFSTAQMNHTDYVLDETHGSISKIESNSFKDGRTYMYYFF